LLLSSVPYYTEPEYRQMFCRTSSRDDEYITGWIDGSTLGEQGTGCEAFSGTILRLFWPSVNRVHV